jgi:hypothetical protein
MEVLQMISSENSELARLIFSEVEACLKNRGLIKKLDGYEYYDEGAEAFRDSMVEEFIKSSNEERAGEKKPFFSGKLGLEGAIAVASGKRINGFWKKTISRQIDMNSAIDEYTVSVQGSAIDSSELQVDVARPENVSSRFGEPINLCNQSAQLALEEAELYSKFEAALDKLSSIGKNGKLYQKTIQFYLEDFDEKMSKKDEISALTAFLGVTRKKAKTIKHWALKFLKRELSPFIDFDECSKSMKRNKELAARFKKISDKDLLKSYDKRYNLFLHPYLGQRIACIIRVWSAVDGVKGQGPAPGKQEAVSDDNEAAVKSEVA